jgi:citrate synthase
VSAGHQRAVRAAARLLHGGANEAVLLMLGRIGDLEDGN